MRRPGPGKAKRWLWLSLLALAALPTYYVREILACLLLFSVLFLLSIAGFAVMALAAAGISRLVSWSLPVLSSQSTPLGTIPCTRSIKEPFKFPALSRRDGSSRFLGPRGFARAPD